VTTKLPREISSPVMESNGIVKSTQVVIGIIDCIYHGYIQHFASERLLDVLNRGSIGDQPELPNDFIQLHDTQICCLNVERNSASSNCLLGKTGIQFVAEEAPNVIDSFHIHRGKSFLFTPKEAICVEIHLPSFVVTGYIYIELWQRLLGAFNDNRRFVPVTGASITYKTNAWNSDFEFVAVSRSQIISVLKVE
jgi:hypothetical protein